MRSALLGSVSALLAGAGLVFAQGPARTPTAPPQPITGTVPLIAAPVTTQTAPPTGASQPADAAPTDGATAGTPTASTAESEPRYMGPPLPPPGRFYVDGEFLLWFSKPNSLPPLVTTGTVGSVSSTAAVGQEGTTIVFGQDTVDAGTRLGARLRIGAWLDAEETFGLEVSGFFAEPSGTHFGISSSGTVPLGIPFVNADVLALPGTTTAETSLLLAAPRPTPGGSVPATSGSVNASTRNTILGGDIDALYNLTGGPRSRADLLAGFTYRRLTDDLQQTGMTNALPGGFVEFGGQVFPSPASVALLDHFHTRNDFYGGQIGGKLEVRQGAWFADFRGALGIGVVHQELLIEGVSALNVPGSAPTTAVGGVFAQASNIGKHSRNVFGINPEAGVTLGYQVTSFCRVTAGYSAVYFRNDVIRTGLAIDRLVSQSQIPAVFGPAPGHSQPAAIFNNVDFWVQGAHFGVELDF
jgi:hypothetical protein